MRICRPDYANCSVNVVSSVLRHFGAPCNHVAHAVMDKLLCGEYKNIVLMLFDGMGMDALARHLAADGFLRSHVACELSAVFPSTTVAATTSIESGQTPVEHAWLGWSLYFGEIDRSVDTFINTDQLTGERVAEDSIARRYIPYRTLFDRLNATGRVRAHNVSHFGDVRIDSLDELFTETVRLCREPGKRYVYTYWGEPDHTMHDIGVTPDAVGDILRDIQGRVEALADELAGDTLLVLTADHGLLDTKPVYLCDYPELFSALERAPTVEPRAAALYVKPEYQERFPEIFREALGNQYLLLKSEDALSEGYFGDGAEHRKTRDFLGDYFAIALTEASLYRSRDDYPFIGMHAGLTEMEMRVPLIAVP